MPQLVSQILVFALQRELTLLLSDEYGHESRGCPKPRDWSRVKCMNCQQMGHTKVKCPNPLVSDGGDGADGGFENGGFGDGGAGHGGFEDAAATGGGGGWESAPAEATETW